MKLNSIFDSVLISAGLDGLRRHDLALAGNPIPALAFQQVKIRKDRQSGQEGLIKYVFN